MIRGGRKDEAMSTPHGVESPEPDDSYAFAAIVAELDEDQLVDSARKAEIEDRRAMWSAADESRDGEPVDGQAGAEPAEPEQPAAAEEEQPAAAEEEQPAAVEPKPVEPKPAEPKPAAAEAKPAEPEPPAAVQAQPAEPAAAEPQPTEAKATEAPARAPEVPSPEPEKAPAAASLLDVNAPELVLPPRPEFKESKVLDACADAFPHLVWLSVIAGWLGQVVGWGETFGGSRIGWIVAGILGGVFEFIMVAASGTALRDLGKGRSLWQVGVFLAVGTACAGVAVWMTVHHFTGALALAGKAAAACSAIGYLAHVASHWFEEFEKRRKLEAWAKDRDRVQAKIDARASKQRAAQEREQELVYEVRAQQIRAVATATTNPTPAESQSTVAVPAASDRPSTPRQAGRATPASKPVAKASRASKGKATYEDAKAVFVPHEVMMAPELEAALAAKGLTASERSFKNWSVKLREEQGIPIEGRTKK